MEPERDIGAMARRAQEQSVRVHQGAAGALAGERLLRPGSQLLAEARALRTKAAAAEAAANPQNAYILHSHIGLGLEQYARNAERLNLAAAFDPLTPLHPTSVEDFLANERYNAVMTAIAKAANNSIDDYQQHHYRALSSEWKSEKDEIRKILGAGDIADATATRFVTGESSEELMGSAMDSRMVKYAKVVNSLVDSMVNNTQGPFPVVKEMQESSQVAEVSYKDDIAESWDVLRGMIASGSSGTLGHDFYRKSEFREPTTRRKALTDLLVRNARATVQLRYRMFVKHQLEGSGSRFSAESRAGIAEFAGGMLEQQRHSGRNSGLAVAEDMCWPNIYYSLRCGFTHLAMDFATGSESAPLLQEALAFFQQGRISNTPSEVRTRYEQAKARNFVYERAVWNILGRCEPERETHREIAVNIEDFLWIRLHMVPNNPERQPQVFANLQRLMSETYGESYFQADSEPWKYFRILLLTGQFEKAIEFLRGHDAVLAVHFAVPLVYYGILNMAQDINTPMLSTIHPGDEDYEGEYSMQYRLNYGQLIQYYVETFARTDPKVALRYLFLVRDVKTKHGMNLFLRGTADVVMESKQRKLLVGDCQRTDGWRIRWGDIIHLCISEEDRRTFVSHLAMEMLHNGYILDAIDLYDMADDHDRVIQLVNEQLSQEASGKPDRQTRLQQLVLLAQSILKQQRYKPNVDNQAHERGRQLQTMQQLLAVSHTLSAFGAGDLDRCEKHLKELASFCVLPLKEEDVHACQEEYERIDSLVIKHHPQLLVCAMKCTLALFQQHQSRGRAHPSDVVHCHERAKALSTYIAHNAAATSRVVRETLAQLSSDNLI